MTEPELWPTLFMKCIGLNLQEPYYVRCIKPNEEKSPVAFNDERSQHQVLYLGLLENVRVRRAGFAYRMHYTRFLLRFVANKTAINLASLHISRVKVIS